MLKKMTLVFSMAFFVTVTSFCGDAAAAKTKLEIKFGTVAPADTPWATTLEDFRDWVLKESKKAGTDVKFKTYLGGQLGGELEILQGIRRGRIQGGGLTAAALASVIPELDVLEIPYLFSSNEEADFVLDNYLYEPFQKIFEKRGFVLVSWAENGWRNIGLKSKFVKKPSDLKGAKVRSQESKTHMAFWKKMNANAVPISVTEVLPSLQTGMVEGFDNTPLFTVAAEWHTAIKYYTVTEHIYQPGVIVYSQRFWKKLTDTQRKILMGDGNGLAVKARSGVRALGNELIDVLKETGVNVYRLSDKEKNVFKSYVKGIEEKLVADIGGQAQRIYQLIQEGKSAFQKKNKK